MTFLGAGIGYRRQYRAALLAEGGLSSPSAQANRARPSVLEIIPDHFFADPSALEPLAAAYPMVFHDVGLSIGTADGPAHAVSRARIDRIVSLIQIGKPALLSDHVAMTRSPSGIDLGHLCPVWTTRETVGLLCDRIRAWEDALQLPVALENIAAPFVIPGGDMAEPELFCELVAKTNCGMLLDLTNVLANAHNFGFDPVEWLARYPLEAVVQVHLAGGVIHNELWIDTHSHPVADDSYDLLVRIRDRAAKLAAIIVERDERLPPLAELVAEARRAEMIWTMTNERSTVRQLA